MIPVEYVKGKEPARDERGRLIIERAPEITWGNARDRWQEMINNFGRIDLLRESQIVVLTSPCDVTPRLVEALREKPFGGYPVATTLEQNFPDSEWQARVGNEQVEARAVYIIGSMYTERDFSRLRRVAYHYKHVLRAEEVTAIFPFTGTSREDKNVDNQGSYKGNTVNIAAELGGLSCFVNRIIAIEPHSSATQAFAADFGIPLFPLSPWKFMAEEIRRKGIRLIDETIIKPNAGNAVIVRPDKGRNIAAMRMGKFLGLSGVSFNKERISGSHVNVFSLTPEEIDLVKERVGILYDDEASTFGTVYEIAERLDGYGCKALAALLVHLKLTPGWENKIGHCLLTTVLGTDTRRPIGNIQLSSKIEIVSLRDLILEIIRADMNRINFWEDSRYQGMILQPLPNEDCG